MHKITKGLKKKKKGKKSKHKDEELFKPEELEAYRRKQAEHSTESGQNEEWKKFIALTSDVDDILKKTQGDLSRIKETSFFQRVPPPSEVKQLKETQLAAAAAATSCQAQKLKCFEVKELTTAELGIVELSESESEEEEDDDIFDTAYIDAIATGEVKLAYIPESPTDEILGDDPFDTTIAEKAILGPIVERKGKKLVPIGPAVEVLTGRAQIPTCATARPASNRRQVLKEKDLLLGSFDDNANSIPESSTSTAIEIQKTLLDDDAPPIETPIDLSKSLYIPPVTPIVESQSVDEEDEDFAALAAESLTKTSVPAAVAVPVSTSLVEEVFWAEFDATDQDEEEEKIESDPFDTTFAENILPGKAELKLIENEILHESEEFSPRINDQINKIINKVSIKVTDPSGQRESISSLDRVSESDLNLIQPNHRDLLGGSNTDLSNLGDQPLRPHEQIDVNYIEYCDPFNTSNVQAAPPGHTELKFLEEELLSDIREAQEEDEFDPRAGELPDRTPSRPDVLNFTAKTVSFDLPSPDNNLELTKVAKPLTPFYVRKASIADVVPDNKDPFDTSFVSEFKPGKVELQILEKELFDPKLVIEDNDFNPRDESKIKIEAVVQSIKDIANNKQKPKEKRVSVDLLDTDNLVAAKVLTPAAEIKNFDIINYSDPFDTTTVEDILPGKTELKLLEAELISDDFDLEFNPRVFEDNLLESNIEIVIRNPLEPIASASFEEDEVDPFDTSIANNIAPGKTELKLLESELCK